MKTMLMMCLGLVILIAGCQTTVTDKSNMAFAAGTALAVGYSSQGPELTPEQKKIAVKVVEVFKQIGEEVTAENVGNIGPAVDAALVKNIQDPQQLAAARGFAAVFLNTVKPYTDNQTVQDAAVIFASFCRGVSAIQIK